MYLHNRIISLRGQVSAHKTSLTHHFLLKCLYQTRKVGDHVFVVLRISILPLSTILILCFGIVRQVLVFVFPILLLSTICINLNFTSQCLFLLSSVPLTVLQKV